MPGRERQRLLILGGTGEAASLARAAVEAFGDRLDVITSLAGRTPAPILPPGTIRQGGFGGVTGLADYLRAARIDLPLGTYRARIFYGNLDSLSDNGLQGDDHYSIVMWKGAPIEPIAQQPGLSTKGRRDLQP